MAKRQKMSVAQRAKQFMPFAALKGYEEALAAAEKQPADKIILTQERKEELDRVLHFINRNDIVEVVYYKGGEYLKKQGMVARLDKDAGILKVVNEKIPFEEIYQLEVKQFYEGELKRKTGDK